MASFKAVIYPHRKNQAGLYPVKIRVVHKRKPKYLPTDFVACSEELTKDFQFKRGTSYQDDTQPLIKRYKDICRDHASIVDTMDVYQLASFLTQYEKQPALEAPLQESSITKLQASVQGGNFCLDIFDYGEIHKKRCKKKNNADIYTSALNALRRYITHGNADVSAKVALDINHITTKFVEGFIQYLQNEPARPGRKKGKRGPSLYASTLRALHNAAKKEYNDPDLGIVRIPLSPFEKAEIPPITRTDKEPLTLEQLRAVFQIPDDSWHRSGVNNLQNLARDVGILSFLLIGMNTCDLFNCTDIKGDIIKYNRTKTENRREDQAEMRVNITPAACALVDKYRDKTKKRVFNFYQQYANPENFNSALNKGLKKIGEKIGFDDLETYTFRRTWSTIAWNNCGINEDIIDFCLAHSTQNKLAHIYITKNWNIVYLSNIKVIDFVLSDKTGIRVSKDIDSIADPKALIQLLNNNPALAKEVLSSVAPLAL